MTIKNQEGEINEGLFSSEKQDWVTPEEFFKKVNEEFNFTLDAAATAENTKCYNFITPEENALSKLWGSPQDVVWCNPPYSEISAFIKQGYESSVANSCIVVMLLPARPDTRWFRDYASHGVVRFVVGRLKFEGAENSAPFPSMLVIFNPGIEKALGLGPDNIIASCYDWKS